MVGSLGGDPPLVRQMMRIAVTRPVPESLARCELTRSPRYGPTEAHLAVLCPMIAKMFAGNRELRELLLRSKVDSVQLLSEKLHVHYARSERDPAHAELLFSAATSLADAIDAIQPDYTPEIIGS